MKLNELVKDFLKIESINNNPEIKYIVNDSRKAVKGSLFIAITGYKEEGVKYIEDAVNRGAVAVIAENKYKGRIKELNGIDYVYVDDTRYYNLLLAKKFFRNPSKDLVLIGVTGTNGKTTITYIIEGILKKAGFKTGVIGTISYRYGNREIKASNTTPDAIDIQSMLKEMRDSGITNVVMEVSSHALFMKRVDPVDYKYAIFTNLSQDHLDFHKDMESYFQAKSLLFRKLGNNSNAIINIDDEYGRKLVNLTRASIKTYGLSQKADIRGSIVSLTVDGTKLLIDDEEFTTKLVGEHNIYNILAAYTTAREMGIEKKLIKETIEKITPAPGRFERVNNNKGYNVFVDYAHTPDALEHLLDAANNFKTGRIITVFGCGGDRDRGKRPLMGKVVEEKSDIAIVTSDNPRSEDPIKIIEEIKKGLSKNNHVIIPDRKEAIYKAIEIANKNDIVLIAGKGHEDYQILKDRTIHFDDREVAAEAIKDMG